MLQKKQIVEFQTKILSWYVNNKRDLPWRKTRDPYKILVSEVMLQQTQVSRVVPKYEAWLHTLPTINHLAQASTPDVLRLWSGLGYNRRALYLQKTAKAIMTDHKGHWPNTIEDLKVLPGIGDYTARAIACFAYGQQVAVVDTNVKKVILIEVLKEPQETKRPKEIIEIAEKLLPQGKAYDWNQALMDYASAVLKKEKIPVPKQSKFVGSNRYYRGRLVKLLLERKVLPAQEVGSLLKDDFSKQDTKWLSELLKGLEREGFIRQDNSYITLTH